MQQALLDTMARQVAQQCEDHLAVARQKADAIIADAKSKAESRRVHALEQAHAEAERHAKRALELALRAAENETLTMEHAVANEVLVSVGVELHRLAMGERFPGILEGLLAELVEYSPKNGTILAPPAHAELCRAWLQKQAVTGLTVQPDPDLVDGIAFQDAERTYRVTNSLSARFAKVQNEARRICLDTLFGVKVGH
ncbi:MAG: ATP synthase F0 subunit B [Candidatus Hydrogenedentales bacterium]|jgi:vacuolar-type H+-ATPase subunit E/Vma4